MQETTAITAEGMETKAASLFAGRTYAQSATRLATSSARRATKPNATDVTLSPPARFQPPPKLFRIGEVMAGTGLSRQTIHNYTLLGLIREAAWTEGGHRLYPMEVFERLARVVTLRTNHSLEEVMHILGPMNVSERGALPP